MSDAIVQTIIRLESHGERTAGAPLAPPDLRAKLLADVEAQESNLTDVILTILSDRYKVPVTLARRKTKPKPNGAIRLRIPVRLYGKVANTAANNSRSPQRQIIADLCQHYGLRLVAPIKQKRRRVVRPAA